MSLPSIIGLGGVARAGKDTVATVLNQVYGYRIASYSDILNQALYTLDRAVGQDAGVMIPLIHDFGRETIYARYADLVDEHGYEKAKEFAGVRRLLQAMGTEVGRNILGDNVWVEALFNNLPPGNVVITNVRFPNEFAKVKSKGGVCWRIIRPGFTPSNGHISDTALDGFVFDQHIENDGTVGDLAQKVVEAVLWHQADSNPVHRAFNLHALP